MVASRTLRAGPPGSRRTAIVASASRRADAEVERDLELLAGRFPRRKPLSGTAQNRRSFRCAAGEEEHAAELDRGRSDRACVLAALDDLRERRDRLRRTGAGVRPAELEQNSGVVARGRRLVEGARKQGGCAGCVTQGHRVAGAVAQQRHCLEVAAGLASHDVCGDLAGGRSALFQDSRRLAMQPLALGGREVAVDRRAQDRVGEADRATGFHDARGHQRRHRHLHVDRGESGQSRGVTD